MCTDTTDMVQKQNGGEILKAFGVTGNTSSICKERGVPRLVCKMYHMLVIVLASFSITFLPGSGDLQ